MVYTTSRGDDQSFYLLKGIVIVAFRGDNKIMSCNSGTHCCCSAHAVKTSWFLQARPPL